MIKKLESKLNNSFFLRTFLTTTKKKNSNKNNYQVPETKSSNEISLWQLIKEDGFVLAKGAVEDYLEDRKALKQQRLIQKRKTQKFFVIGTPIWVHRYFPSVISNHLLNYPSPTNLNYFWGFGSLALLFLGVQIITGILLAMHYVPHMDLAFASVEHIMRNVKHGWQLRYLHANGASFMFITVYVHMLRGMYFGSYNKPNHHLWFSGILIYFLMVATAFMGYVLPWGQMSFWAATVITNLFSAIPFVGESIVEWLWGGFSVDNATLKRFFSLHYLLPFAILGLAFVHIVILHINGSNNPLGYVETNDKIQLIGYFLIKDVVGIILILIIYCYFVFYDPNFLSHPLNNVMANPMVTPPHIVPEWYFLPLYAILRSIPNKLGGVIAMVLGIVILAVLPFVAKSVYQMTFTRKFYNLSFWLFFVNACILGWIGQKHVEMPYILIGQVSSILYFAYFLIILPLIVYFEGFVISEIAKKKIN